MKKISVFLVTALLALAGCNTKPAAQGAKAPATLQNQKMLVAYFSATGNTKKVAENLAAATGADIYEIKPAVPYTGEDLNWRDSTSRSSVEMNDKTVRPELAADDFSPSGYDTILLGFPIWWGRAPSIVHTFLEKYDFSNKKIIIFATSGSSGLGGTDVELKPSVAASAQIIKGKVLNGNPSVEELKRWVDSVQ